MSIGLMDRRLILLLESHTDDFRQAVGGLVHRLFSVMRSSDTVEII